MGNPSPFPSVNIITGFWKNDTYKFYKPSVTETICRLAITVNYFQESNNYYGWRDHVLWPEKFLANFTDKRVIARKEKGNLFFVDLRKIVKGYLFDPAKLPNIGDRIVEKHINKYLRGR